MNTLHAFRPLLAVIATLVVIAPVAPASADPIKAMRVSYSDLNLASAAGVATLYGRLQQASETVCGPTPLTVELRQQAAWATCRNAALTDAVAQTGSPALAALHERRTGTRAPAAMASRGPDGR